jgi:hypothetical protein
MENKENFLGAIQQKLVYLCASPCMSINLNLYTFSNANVYIHLDWVSFLQETKKFDLFSKVISNFIHKTICLSCEVSLKIFGAYLKHFVCIKYYVPVPISVLLYEDKCQMLVNFNSQYLYLFLRNAYNFIDNNSLILLHALFHTSQVHSLYMHIFYLLLGVWFQNVCSIFVINIIAFITCIYCVKISCEQSSK